MRNKTTNVQIAATIWLRVSVLKNSPIATNIIPIVVRPRPERRSGPTSKSNFAW